MRKPLPGEEPCGLAERTFKEIGLEAWKLEPHEVELLRRELTKALDKRVQEWMDAWPNRPGPPSYTTESDMHLDEFDKNEFFDVYRTFRPEATREEFERDWEEFQRDKARKRLQ